jgi:hypothetical protein
VVALGFTLFHGFLLFGVVLAEVIIGFEIWWGI